MDPQVGGKKEFQTSSKRSYRVSKLSEEEIEALMATSESEFELDDDCKFDSDDSIEDPDFRPDDSLEVRKDIDGFDVEIATCLNEMNEADTSDAFINTSALSINLSDFVDAVERVSPLADATASTSKQALELRAKNGSKPKKRVRSPLPEFEDNGPKFNSSNGGFSGTGLLSIEKNSKEFTNIVWKNKNMQLHINEVVFCGKSELPNTFKGLNTPYKCFMYLFTSDIFQKVATETNRAAEKFNRDNINHPFSVNETEIRQYVGILIYMSLYRFPSLESYWSKNAFEPISSTMTFKRFEKIKRFLCFSNEEERVKKGEPDYDPLYRIRPISEKLNERFDMVPKTARLCVDEQMCATKIKHHLRQYMPNKPHKWGVKFFVLCDSYGFSYRFEIYNGAGDNVVLPDMPDLGATANVVIRLSQTIPNFANHILYFDNLYTSLPLLVYLRARGIYSLGTVRANRINNCKFPSEKETANCTRGYSIEYTSSAYGIDISTVLWKDTKLVRLASTYVGILPFQQNKQDCSTSKISRYDRKNKQYIELECPQIIKEYNRHMGGVDLMDGLMGRYHIRLKTRNAMIKIFYHLIDMAITNAYILHRRINANHSVNNLPSLPEFRESVAAGLCKYKPKHVGRPLADAIVTKSGVGKRPKIPEDDNRYDKYDHFPTMLDIHGKKRCKHCKQSDTQMYCMKCDLNLCIRQDKNSFLDFHTQH